MKCRRLCVLVEELNYSFGGLARTPGFLCAAMVWRGEFIIVSSRMAVFLGDRTWQRYSGALTHSYLAEGTRPTSRFLDPTRWI